MQKKITDRRIDIIIGKKLRYYRMRKNFTQKVLGAAVNVTTQQIQKYEQGQNRISVSRLIMIADFLKISPVLFLEDDLPLGNQQLLYSNSSAYKDSGRKDIYKNSIKDESLADNNFYDFSEDNEENENINAASDSEKISFNYQDGDKMNDQEESQYKSIDEVSDLESLRIIHAYNNIKDNRLKSSIYYLIKFLSKVDKDN